MTQTLASILPEIKKILLEIGHYVRSQMQTQDKGISIKSDKTAVTQTDLYLESLLKRSLQSLYPADHWVSEEGSLNDLKEVRGSLWIVDPLDGTKEFIAGIPEFAISAARIDIARQEFFAVIYNPLTTEFGLSFNDEFQFGALDESSLKKATYEIISVSRSEFSRGLPQWFLSEFPTARPVGSIAYKILRTCMDIESATISFAPKSLWDIAAGFILAKASGKRVFPNDINWTNLKKMRISPPLVVADEKNYEQVINLVKNNLRDSDLQTTR